MSRSPSPRLTASAAPWLCLMLALLSLLPAAPAHAQSPERLPAPVAAALKAAGIPRSAVAVLVQDVDARMPRLSVNADQPMNPASVMKVVTTLAALQTLGPAYTWRTEALAAAPLADGVLDGDLHLRGGGDPRLTFESFWLLLRSLRSRGLREIRGDLVLDRSLFDTAGHDPGAFDGKPLRAYNVGPDALMVSFKAVRFSFLPDPGAGPPQAGVSPPGGQRSVGAHPSGAGAVAVLAQPHPAQLDVVSALRLTDGPCGDWREAVRPDLIAHGERVRLVFSGTYAADCGEKTWHLGVLEHPQFLLGVFRQLWQELGGGLGGGVRDGAVPPEARLLAQQDSAPLAEVMRDINKLSINVMARQLLLTLGAEAGHRPARAADGEAAVAAWLEKSGIPAPELVLDNGSGLSRRARVSADTLGRILRAGFRSAVMPEFMASLPVVGTDGTMKRRGNGSGVAGQAHVKSGYLESVRAIAGYVLDRTGHRQVVVCLINHAQAAAAQPALDALLAWTWERGWP
ncbi:MAG: D-alanyl-D-alanine carboxypeptidase/D-alanyl-D-alanine-endopeptidase [Betaproteobacteria bacterium]|nr:D-alanyl-D-alanine carboxypeptidase/D-alanyl-D-alanine-endopeptidase [Betaproteobacteria bacterium]